MLADLFDGNFAAYFAAADAGRPLWLFVHVPKTAGSSLIAEAGAILQPAYNIDIDHTDTQRSYRDRFDDAVQAFIAKQADNARQAGGAFRFCTGHIDARQAGMIRDAVSDVQCFTFLREPMARLVSDYRYQRSAMNTARAQFLATTPSFEAYVARPHVHNKMARSLAPRKLANAGDAAGCVAYIMREFAFVGLQEMYPLGVRALTRAMGEMREPTARVRVNDGEDDAVVLGAADEQALRALNALDLTIYDAFVARWAAVVKDGLAQFLESSVRR